MIHARFTHTPYEAGYRWGKRLYDHGFHIHQNTHFVIDEKRKNFASLCMPIYERYAQNILSEIKGIADGQKMPFEELCAFLFSMYCFDLDHHCTCFACYDDDHIFLARNSDFLTEMEQQYMNCLYQCSDMIPFQANTTAFVQMEDGMNAYGLAVGLTFVYTNQRKPGLNGGMLIRYLLEHCRNVKDACAILQRIPIASSQTLTMADSQGNLLVVECMPDHIETIKPNQNKPFVAGVNRFQTSTLKQFHVQGVDDWRSMERYQTVRNTLHQHASDFSLQLVEDILSGNYGFMCQYDRKQGADTVWSVVYDVKANAIYRVEGNPSRRAFKEDLRWKKISEHI